ncbi:MAG: DUF1906 domain-containing protein [Herpetosiphonaceae bacterium]|nr:DUF1906 domain-containing protein [Herpetosiphonaceae bacterium]
MQHRVGLHRYTRWLISLVIVSLLFITSGTTPIHANVPGPTVNISGRGWFDACSAPSVSAMQTWWNQAPSYWNTGVYIGGINRACAQSNLSYSWVSQVASQGWAFIPIYVGRQAPCSNPSSNFALISTDPYTAQQQAISAANLGTYGAEATANTLGFSRGTIVYLDIEGYDQYNTSQCESIVNTYVQAWVKQMKADGYRTGVYGSSCSSHPMDWTTFNPPPDDVWLASYPSPSPPSVLGLPCIGDGYWSQHQRHHQYTTTHDETYAGVTISIDSDCAEGVVAGPAYDDGSPNTCP